MPNNLYEPFLTATHNVFQLMLDITEIHDYPADTFECDDKLDITIGIIGDYIGGVMYRFPRTTSLNIVNIMSGMELDSVDDFVTSAIAEIANIISGNVLTMLAEDNLICDILPPELRGPDDSTDYKMHTSSCISTAIGDVWMDVRINPAQ
jgi:chemotaxis protein CheX